MSKLFIHNLPVVNNLSVFGYESEKYLIKICKNIESKTIVQDDGSWLWVGTVHYGGYGIISLYQAEPLVRKTLVIHRLVYHLLRSEVPNDLVLMHQDDNKLSIHPDNFVLGTKLDNNQDMVDKGRQHTVFEDADVHTIVSLYDSGDWTQKQISEKYNCSESAVNNLLRGDILPHIPRKTFKSFDITKKHFGEDVASSKLTDELVLEIRQKYDAGGYSFGALGREYGVNSQTISNICKRKSWTHI